MMMAAAPSAALVMIKPDLLLAFEIVALDPPAQLGQVNHTLERDVGRQDGEPVVIRLGVAVRPLDQPPLFVCWLAPSGIAMRRAYPRAGKARGQDCIAALPPSDLLPGIGGKLQGQRLDRDRLMRRGAAQPGGTLAAARSGCWRQRRLAGPPDRRAGLDASRVRHHEFADPRAQFTVKWVSPSLT